MMNILFFVFVIVLIVGGFKGGLPKASENRLELLRFEAQKMQLNPSRIVPPTWMMSDQSSKNQKISQYTKVNDTWRLPEVKFLAIDGIWQATETTTITEYGQTFAQTITGRPLDLGDLTPFIKAMTCKANSISIFWEDNRYSKTLLSDATESQFWDIMKKDLTALSNYLDDLAQNHT